MTLDSTQQKPQPTAIRVVPTQAVVEESQPMKDAYTEILAQPKAKVFGASDANEPKIPV